MANYLAFESMTEGLENKVKQDLKLWQNNNTSLHHPEYTEYLF